MLLEYFLTIFAVSIILLLLGKHFDVMFGFVGGAFIVLLGFVTLFSPLEVHTTDTVHMTFTYADENTTQINSSSEIHTPVYQELDEELPTGQTFNHIIGYFMVFVGVMGIVYMSMTRSKR